MKMTMVLDLEIEPGELAQRLAHQPRLHSRQHVAHLAFDFGFRRQGGHGVDHDHVHRAGANECVGDLQRLLAGIGLGEDEFIQIDASLRA